jgi:hypothetical protein
MVNISWNECVKNEEVLKQSKKEKEHPTYNKKMEGKLDCSHQAQKLPSKARY